MAKIKRHPFFNQKNSSIDWDGVSKGNLKMPAINPRPVVKSPFPFKYGQSSEDGDDDEYFRKDYESSEVQAEGDNQDDDEGMPQMVEVHVNGSPKIP